MGSKRRSPFGFHFRPGLVTVTTRKFPLTAATYVSISVFFLSGVIASHGDVAQQDWGIPVTASAALNDLHSLLFVWQYNGFGGVSYFFGWFFTLLNAALAPFGFVGGAEIKILSVSLVALAGITTYVLARSFGLKWFSSFLSGLFYMTTPVVFNWLMFGWSIYIIAYDLLPLVILLAERFLHTSQVRYALAGGIITSIALEQPTFVLVYPLAVFLFAIFESRGSPRTVLRGLVFILISLSVWLLTLLYFFTSFFNAGTFSFYTGSFYGVLEAQYSHLSHLWNPIRLWGSNYNYQFETYYPTGLILLSFTPALVAALAMLLRPRDRRVLFMSTAYLLTFFSYEIYNNLHYLVFNLPFGSIFEAPSVFLVPASLGLALLIGFANEAISREGDKQHSVVSKGLVRSASHALILLLVVSGGIPWWTGQVSGNQIPGPPTKLNLYQLPAGYVEWSNIVGTDYEHFVLHLPYLPGTAGNILIMDTSYFSGTYEGVNSVIYYGVNNLPSVSISNSSKIMKGLLSGSSQVAEKWGSSSIQYVVVYTNVVAPYKISDLLNNLSLQIGLVKVASLPDVVVFKDLYARPVVYVESANVIAQIISHDPTSYTIRARSSSPFLLKLNQAYSDGWQASVNGTSLVSGNHVSVPNGLGIPINGWQINQLGTLSINIYYKPQTAYVISLLFSIGVFFVILLSLVVVQANDIVRKHTRQLARGHGWARVGVVEGRSPLKLPSWFHQLSPHEGRKYVPPEEE